jgi:hypothetical protein
METNECSIDTHVSAFGMKIPDSLTREEGFVEPLFEQPPKAASGKPKNT